MRLTLSSYLNQRWFVPHHEQLLLIDNPNFYGHFTQCLIRQKRRDRAFEKIVKHMLGFQYCPPLNIPQGSHTLFLGYRHATLHKSLSHLPSVYRAIAESPQFKYRLIIGKGDYDFSQDKLRNFPGNLEYVIANNVTVDDPRVGYLPMGRDFRSVAEFENVIPTQQKEILCYCNFSVSTHPIRQQLYERIKDKNYIVFEHMGKFLKYSISRADFFRQLVRSKFTICPRGNGIDTFRLWDCLYSGTIPIVVREAIFHDHLSDLPILFLDSYADYEKLTVEYLESTYQRMLDTKYNYSKLLLSTWLQPLRQTQIA